MNRLTNFLENPNIKTVAQRGPYTVIQYERDLSVDASNALSAYYAAKMNVHKRQLVINLAQSNGICLQHGAMQWMLGNVQMNTGIKGVGDLIGKAFKGAATKEAAVNPEYYGDGLLVTEPTYKFLLPVNVSDFGGSLVVDDECFYSCDLTLQRTIQTRQNMSSAVAGGKGLFNFMMNGRGIAVIESYVPMEELVEVDLQDDVIKVDGSFVIAWSGSLSFTVERAGQTLIGSAASGEGLVNVYRGSGKLLMAPIR